MPRYTDEQIEQVRMANDIVDVIGSYVRLKRSGSGYVGLCPFHNEKTPSFSVNPAMQIYKCFGCGASGSVITFVMEYENNSFPEAMEQLAQRAGISLPKKELSAQQKMQENQRLLLREINAKAAMFYYAKLKSKQGSLGLKYLQERGLSDETIKQFGLGYAGQDSNELYRYLRSEGYDDTLLKESGLFKMNEKNVYDKFFNRVIFPIMDTQNRVLGFGGRVMGDAKPKYLNSPETKIFDKSSNVFGLNYAKLGKHKNIILCEGYMDVISLHQAGFTNAVASLGTAFTENQALLLKRFTKEILLCYDSDGAGVSATLRAIRILRSAQMQAKVIRLSPHKDPDEFIKALGIEAFQRRIEEAQNSFFFEIEMLQQQYDLSDPEQKSLFYEEMAKKLLVFQDKLRRDNYLESLCAKYSIPKEDLRDLVIRFSNGLPERDSETVQPKKQRQAKKDKDITYSYRLLLSWLVNKPELFSQISKIITPEDFVQEQYRMAAGMLFEQIQNGEIQPVRIINHFQDVEEQRAVSDMFQTQFELELTVSEQEKAINDLVYKIKMTSLDDKMHNLQDISLLEEIIAQKRELQNTNKWHIVL